MPITETEKNGLKCPKPLSESYTGNTKKSGNICKIISPSFFELLSAASLGNDAVRGFSDDVVATVLKLIEEINQ